MILDMSFPLTSTIKLSIYRNMYNAFFHLKENPFNLTPDPKFLYLSPCHREALEHLLYGIRERKGFIAVTGGIGTGKTTLCRALLNRLDESVKTALIFSSIVSDIELLDMINQEFGIDHRDLPAISTGAKPSDEGQFKTSRKRHIDALNRFLLENFSQGRNAVLLIDEAQNLPFDTLEQIRLLSNLETEKEKLIQIILVGQPELGELLASPSLRQLNERITVRYELRPLDRTEIQSYVEHRLSVAGGQGVIRFTRGTFRRIYEYSRGIPRRINAICDRALLIAYAEESYSLSKNAIDRAAKEVHAGIPDSRPDRISGKRSVASAVLILLLILVSVYGGWYFNDDITGFLTAERISAHHSTNHHEPAPVSEPVKPKDEPVFSAPAAPKDEMEGFYLDARKSIAGLFELYRDVVGETDRDRSEEFFTVVSLEINPEYYVRLKKPFRAFVPEREDASGNYLLIREATEEGAMAVNRDRKHMFLSKAFFLRHWNGSITIIYPDTRERVNLKMGMKNKEVLRLQNGLQKIGYPVSPTGEYDDSTLNEVKRFQRNFGLEDDGIAGTKTRALLYQTIPP